MKSRMKIKATFSGTPIIVFTGDSARKLFFSGDILLLDLLTGLTGPRRHPSLHDFYRRFLMGVLPLFLGLACSRRP